MIKCDAKPYDINAIIISLNIECGHCPRFKLKFEKNSNNYFRQNDKEDDHATE